MGSYFNNPCKKVVGFTYLNESGESIPIITFGSALLNKDELVDKYCISHSIPACSVQGLKCLIVDCRMEFMHNLKAFVKVWNWVTEQSGRLVDSKIYNGVHSKFVHECRKFEGKMYEQVF